MGRKLKRPWGNLLGNSPIERTFAKDDPRLGELGENLAKEEQWRRMCRLKDHLGIEGTSTRAWYEFSVRVASYIDPALTIEDHPKESNRVTTDWAGGAGAVLLEELKVLREEFEAQGTTLTDEQLICEHQIQFSRYKHLKTDTLLKGYYRAKGYRGK